jgi:hypothetical protein
MPQSHTPEILHNFLSSLRENELVEKLLEYLPNNIYFFVKDAQGRLMLSNRLFWEKMGLARADQLLGKTDYDLFWALQAEAYMHDDAEVWWIGTAPPRSPSAGRTGSTSG